MIRIVLQCLDGAIAATTCPGEQEAIGAVERIRIQMELFCSATGNAAASVVTVFFTVIIMTCVNLYR